jgi:adenosylcobinamide-GDP ribazoletransferase
VLRTLWRQQLGAAHLALTFLTTLPLPHVQQVQDGDFARASAYYPLAGYAVGGAVALTLWLPLPLPDGVRAALAVGAWLLVTGMLHFDGLVDSADALFAMKSPQRRLEIIQDVHVGAFGLATGALSLLTLWSLLAADIPAYAAVVAAVAARLVLLAPMNLFPAARPESLGARSREGRWGLALLLAVPALLLPGAGVAFLAAFIAALLVARFATGRLGGGISGDIYGLIVVVAELVALGAFAWGRA